MSDLPEEMSFRDFRRHPVTAILNHAAMGRRGLPSRVELDELDLPTKARTAVRQECERVASMFDEGDQAEARSESNEAAADVIASLDDRYQDPDYLEADKPDPTDHMTPQQLAEHVSPRRY